MKHRKKRPQDSAESKQKVFSSFFTQDRPEELARVIKILKQNVMDLEQMEARHRQTVEALKQSEEKFRLVFENSAVAITVANEKEQIISWNPLTEKLFGMTKQDLHLKPLQSFYPPEEWQRIRSMKIREKGLQSHLETRMVKKDGEFIDVDVSISVLKDSGGNVTGSIGIIRNVTERKKAEKALRDSEEKFRTVFENSAVAITVADAEEKIVSWNPFTEVLLGMKREDLQYKLIRSFYPPEEWHKMRSMKLRETGKIAHLDTKVIKKNGDLLDVKVSITVLKDEKGNVTGSIGILRDITQRKKSEKALQEAKEAALKLAKVKSQFLANMSHEIRTPMNGVIGMVELLEDTDMNSEQRDYLHTLKTSAESLLLLINDILDSSKIEAGMLCLEKIPFDLRENLMDTIGTLVLRAHTKGLELTCQIMPNVPERVLGDPGRLRQIVVNLVGNAIKFTEYGEVVVRVEGQFEPDEKETALHFSVTDTGIGIAKEKLKSIFTPFTQADNSTTRKYGGTGLGLSISHQLVKLMGGNLWVESPATLPHIHGGGMGSTFHFDIRLGVIETEEAEVNPRFVSLSGLEVLIIDDNVTNARVLKEMIAGWKMKPTVAHNASEAMSLLNQGKSSGIPFDFAIIDSYMPETDGFELVRQIMAQPEFNKLKIIMMTYIGSRGDAEKCRKFGIPAYLTKPVHQSQLLDTLMTLLTPNAAIDSVALITKHSIKESKKHLRILLAEDNLVNQQVALRILEKRGHNVFVADTGRKVVEAVKKETFDMVLMDIQMPEMDGFEATELIRRRERESGSHLTIIAMTANAMEGAREKCLQAGMDGYLAKPIRSQELFELIDKFTPNAEKKDVMIFDVEAGLEHVGGDRDLLRQIVGIFLEDTPGQLLKIKQMLETSDQKMLECYCHGVKGAASNVGAEAVRQIAWDMEKMAKQGDFEKVRLLYPKLEEEFEKTKQYFSKLTKEG
ncbi:MAG: PAS domain S-box protein [Candidatus Omnitrophica bacterium]|nr:PAS domain S-box protein [Candidatus Omnitrophota bacterium]